MRRPLAAILAATLLAGILPAGVLAGTSQTISWDVASPVTVPVGGPTYTPAATADSGLTPVVITIDAASAGVCSISGGVVSFDHGGTCLVDANQAGDGTYDPAPQLQASITVTKLSQTVSITSSAPASAVVGGPAYTVTASADSGLVPAITIDASAASVCSIAGSLVSFLHVGTCVVDANQAGNGDYDAATQAKQSFAVGTGSQTVSITSTAPASAVVGGSTYTVAASATSGLAVDLSIDGSATSVCAIVGTSVSFLRVGTCKIDANQAGNADYTAATQDQQSFAVGKGSQTVNFTSTAPLSAAVGGATYPVAATGGGSLLPVTFTIDASATGFCSITGTTVSFQHVGTCVVDGNQLGNGDYNAAPQAQQSFAVGKGSQTVTFTSPDPTPAKVGAHYTLAAHATSGLAVTFSVEAISASVCSIVGNQVAFAALGACVVDANQAGNADWNAAPTQKLNIGVGDQKPVCVPTTPIAVTMNVPATGPSNCTDADGQALTYSIGTDGTKGHATIDASGTWTYTPAKDVTGTDSFTVVANDSIINSDPATISVTISNRTDPRNDGVVVVATVPTQIDVLANDRGGSTQPLTIVSVTQGSVGTVTTDGHFVTYDPAGCALGTDVFTYMVTDGVVVSTPISVFVTIDRPGASNGLGGNLPSDPVTDAPSAALTTGVLGSTAPAKVAWCGVAATSVKSYSLLESRDGGTTFSSAYTGTAASSTRGLVVSRSYAWKAQTTDTSLQTGTSAPSASVSVLLTQDSQTGTLKFGGTWSVSRSTRFSGGSERYTSKTSASASYKVVGARSFAIVTSTGIGRGSVKVYVDGKLVATVSERATSTQYKRIVYARALTYGSTTSHTIKLVPSGNGRVDLDGLLILR